MTSLDREPEKNAPHDAFEPSQVNGILRRRARFWGWSPLPRKRARRQSPLASAERMASPPQAGSSGSRSNERCGSLPCDRTEAI